MSGVSISRSVRGSHGLTPNSWSYPIELKAFLTPSVVHPTRTGISVRWMNANVHHGCANHCAYCYARDQTWLHQQAALSELPECDRRDAIICHPDQVEAITNDLQWKKFRKRPAVVMCSSTDPLLEQTRGVYSDLLLKCAKSRIPAVVLSKCIVEDPKTAFPTWPGWRLALGATVTCSSDASSRMVEPGAPPTGARLDHLERAKWALCGDAVPWWNDLVTWVSITPIHSLTGDPAEIADRALGEHNVDVAVAELLHGNTAWCNEHRVAESSHLEIVWSLLEVARARNKPVFLKDELREIALSDADLRNTYQSIVEAHLPQQVCRRLDLFVEVM